MQLSAITRILEQTQPLGLGKSDGLSLPHTLTSGPFSGLEIPFASATANAVHVQRSLIDTYLITHPHLDHISGFVVNTAGLPGTRPKRLAGLPNTIAAFKTHIFNNVIWPNLTDENNGAGLVTYMRLVEGGSPALGEGGTQGYMEITDGLAVKVWGVSHGHCIERHSHRGSGSSTRYGSADASSISLGPPGGNIPLSSPWGMNLPQGGMNPSLNMVLQHNRDQMHLANTSQGVLAGSSAPSGGQRASSVSAPGGPVETLCVYDSSAYFLRDVETGREILMFGDVEPDSISLSPRNQHIWQEAAPKIAAGKLAAIFIECSYDDSQSVDRLFGHLTPRFVIQEMASLAEEVRFVKRQLTLQQDGRESSTTTLERGLVIPGLEQRKRKREVDDSRILTRRRAARTAVSSPFSPVDDPISPRTIRPPRELSMLSQTSLPDDHNPMFDTLHLATPTAELSLADTEMSAPGTPSSVPASIAPSVTPAPPTPFPLKGLKVVMIHMKEKLNDGPPIEDIIKRELDEYEAEAQLGCEFVISRSGDSMLF